MSQIQFTPKIIIDGSTSNEPFVKFTQNHQWTSSNFCLHVHNGYTNLNGIIINGGLNITDTFYTSNNNNMSFNVTGNNNLIFKTNNLERLRIFNNGNIGIGTTNAQDYKVNINGSINTLSYFRNNIDLDNIYLGLNANCWLFNNTSKILYTDPNCNIANIGIGNTNPFGYLHIGSPNVANSDGNIILSRNIQIKSTSRNFKLGYDADFNFVMGNLVNSLTGNDWTSQFLINYNAPANSLIISSSGNIGINTSTTDTYKVNINGSLNAYAITCVDGRNISNLDYRNITLNSPNLKNLDNWNIITNNGVNVIYNTDLDTYIGIGTSGVKSANNTLYKLNVNGNINSIDYFINGVNIDLVYLNIANAARTYLTINAFNDANIWFKQLNSFGTTTIRLNNQNITNIIQLGIDDPNNYQNLYLNVLGKIKAKFLEGSGELITNINWGTGINQTTVPNFITKEETAAAYYNKIYLDNVYYDNIITNTGKLYASYATLKTMQENIDSVYTSIPPEVIATIISNLSAKGDISIYHSNMLGLPYTFNSSNYGFNAVASLNPNNIITIGGTITASNVRSQGIIYESNISLDNIYISSNNYIKNISNYETKIDRVRSQLTSEKIYPPELSKFNNSTSNIVSTSDYGNGLYIIQSSTILLDTIPLASNAASAPASNLFNNNTDTLPWQNNIDHILYNYIGTDENPYIIPNTTSNLKTGIIINSVEQSLYGHWILLYYSEKFIATKIDIITKHNINNSKINFPKNIYLIATNNNILKQSQDEYNNNNSYTWDILLNNIVLSASDYTNYIIDTIDTNLFKVSLNISKNITAYKYYKLIITSTLGSSAVSIQQLKFYGIENKKEWMHSGNNIYSLSNISIGTINNTSPYILNINGDVYTSSNIYANSNIGIGITSPLGNLHIGTPYSNSDGTLIISKNNNTSNRNFKFGYDSNFNFVLGDFGSNDDGSRKWTKQFYINSNAPENSFMINSYGNIGININNITSNQKLFINGNLNVTGSINQSNINELNRFKSDIYASNNIFILSNLNVSNIFTSNINVSNYISVNGIIYASKNIGIGTSTNLNASLNIQSLNNSIGIWNACSDLNTGDKIASFIGKNITSEENNGFYNYYYHNGGGDNNNYLSWTKSLSDTTADILCMNSLKYVGIGITNPTSLFQIRSGGKFKIGPNDNDYALIGLNDNDDISNTKIYLNGGLNKRIEYYAFTGGHIFYTKNSIEQMRINNSGNISIGTTSDIYKLNINGSLYSSSNIFAYSNIGIGITTPLGNLHIASPHSSSDGTLIISKNDDVNNRNFKFGYDSNFNFTLGDFGTSDDASRTWIKQFYINSNAPENSLIINNTGFIGIGISVPLGNLHIGTPYSSSDGTLIISKNNTTNNRNFKFGYDSSFNFIFGDYGNNDNDISRTWKKQFYINTNASENSLTINSSGNVGIGTTSALDQKLFINGNTTINNGVLNQISSDGNPNYFKNAILINTQINSDGYRLNVNGSVNIQSNLNTSNLIVNNITYLKGLVRIGPSPEEIGYNVYIDNNTCIKGDILFKNGNFIHNGGNFDIIASMLNVQNKSSFIGNVGIGTNSGINNILQVGDGGRLKIANTVEDFTVIGTINVIANTSNTRIILNGHNKINNFGDIQYFTTNSGSHLFYSDGTTQNERFRIDNNGNVGIGTTNAENLKLNVHGNINASGSGTINCLSLISSNSIDIGVDPLDTTKKLNVYGTINVSSNITVASNISANTLISSNINNYGTFSNVGNLVITGDIKQKGAYVFSGSVFNIGELTDTNKTFIIGGNIISSSNITAHSNIETTSLKTLFITNASNIYTSNIIVSGSTIFNSNIIQNNDCPITLSGNLTLNSSTKDDQITVNNTNQNKYSRIKFTNNDPGNNFGYIGIGGTNVVDNYKNNVFIQSAKSIIFNSGNNSTSSIPTILISSNGNIGISTTTANNIFQIGDGGKLRIANNATDYTIIGTSNINLNNFNTRIIINGYDNTGDILYNTTTTGKHLFYSNGGTNELMRIDNTGNVGIGTVNSEKFKLNVNGELNVQNLIKENSSYLSNVYVKLENLSNLNINNFNLKKKFGFNCIIKDKLNVGSITYNSIPYFKYDIDLRLVTKNLTNTSNNYSVNYRLFNIKCFLTNCSFETFNIGVPNILQYDVYMSSNPYIQTTTPPIVEPKSALNICAIGIPENYKLDNILPSYITLLRYDNIGANNFNYLSLVSPHSNLSVSFIIEDYLS